MVTTVNLSDEELSDLKTLTKQDDPAEAVRVAMQDYLRHARRMQLKSLSGRVEMMDNWQELEQAEYDGALMEAEQRELAALQAAEEKHLQPLDQSRLKWLEQIETRVEQISHADD